MADEKPKIVKVEALQAHTYNGQSYSVGDTYDIEEQYADSVQVQGKAARTDRVQIAKAQAKEAESGPASAKRVVKKAGTYKRRDMKAKK